MNRTHAVRVHFSGQQRLRSSVCSLSKVAQFQLQGRQQCAIALALDCKFVYLKTANTCSCPSIVNIVIRQELYDCMTKTNHPFISLSGINNVHLLCSCPTICFFIKYWTLFRLFHVSTYPYPLYYCISFFISLFISVKPSVQVQSCKNFETNVGFFGWLMSKDLGGGEKCIIGQLFLLINGAHPSQIKSNWIIRVA